MLERSDSGMTASRAAFEEVLTYLNSLPLSTPEIHIALEAAGIGWLTLVAETKASPGTDHTAQLHSLAQASESQLVVLEQLSAHYEHSMQMLTGAWEAGWQSALRRPKSFAWRWNVVRHARCPHPRPHHCRSATLLRCGRWGWQYRCC